MYYHAAGLKTNKSNHQLRTEKDGQGSFSPMLRGYRSNGPEKGALLPGCGAGWETPEPGYSRAIDNFANAVLLANITSREDDYETPLKERANGLTWDMVLSVQPTRIQKTEVLQDSTILGYNSTLRGIWRLFNTIREFKASKHMAK